MSVPARDGTNRPRLDLSDESLLDAIASGNGDALGELIRRHRHAVRASVGRIVSCAADAEEVVQDVFVLVWKQALHFRGEAKVATWIHAIARNVAVSRVRRVNPGMLSIDVLDRAPIRPPAPQDDPERRAAAAELRRHLTSRIQRLPRLHRDVVVSILRHGSPKKAAARRRIVAGTFKSRLHRARLALRAALPGALPSHPNG